MWTIENRARYDRSKLRYPSDLTDEEWSHVEPLIRPGKRGGNKRTVNVREVVNGLMYILSTGCQWRAIPKDLPPRSTVYDYFELWSWDGTLDHLHDTLYVKCREQAARDASPTVAIIDSQSVKSAEKGGASIDPPGYDAGKRIKGKKRHLLVSVTRDMSGFRSTRSVRFVPEGSHAAGGQNGPDHRCDWVASEEEVERRGGWSAAGHERAAFPPAARRL